MYEDLSNVDLLMAKRFCSRADVVLAQTNFQDVTYAGRVGHAM